MIYYIESNNYTEIFNITISQFMDYNPPCKECLINIMCMELSCRNCVSVFQYLELRIKKCDKLMDFMIYNKNFDILSKDETKWKDQNK
jgi:hypothetical protein